MPMGLGMRILVLLAAAGAVQASTPYTDGQTIIDIGRGFSGFTVSASGMKWSVATRPSGAVLILKPQRKGAYFGISLPTQSRDLTHWRNIVVAVKNIGMNTEEVYAVAGKAGVGGETGGIYKNVYLDAGKSKVISLKMGCAVTATPVALVGIRGGPGVARDTKDALLNKANIEEVGIYVDEYQPGMVFEVGSFRAEDACTEAVIHDFFPYIDEYGQYIHADWPGKIRKDADLVANARTEEADLAANPGLVGRDKYGGWAAGPARKATGYFRAEKYQGKWWLVDPIGKLFWSHGVDVVSCMDSTPISSRESAFRNLPESKGKYENLYGTSQDSAKKEYRWFRYTVYNLMRKYGEGWQAAFATLIHRRLQSWGLNTIGNWSDPEVCLMRRTPYAVAIYFGAPVIEGSEGYWYKFHDVFNPGFRAAVRDALEKERGKSAGDPWCIGYFVDNEMNWGGETELASAVLSSSASQVAKQFLVEFLKKRLQTIGALNRAWGTKYKNWDDFMASRVKVESKGSRPDLVAFTQLIGDIYFRTCLEEVKRVAPGQLYLGCRFSWDGGWAYKPAAKYCDVISINKYTPSIADFKLPKGLDKPVIIGEFHFGAWDRGKFNSALVEVADQNERGASYRRYVTGALKNKCLVGTHWFQLFDENTTGRGDGENFQCGLLDIADTPYPETISAVREIGKDMYKIRSGK